MTYPNDIMREARRVAFEVAPDEADDERCAFRAAKWEIVASALHKERERCAKIAEEQNAWDDYWDFLDPETAVGRNVTAVAIATAIRTTKAE